MPRPKYPSTSAPTLACSARTMMELYEWLQSQEGKNQYVKDLIRKDMEEKA